jgi:hypothetical protein
MSYDISILVNGNRCKQYFHEGKTLIEAKDGSEYTIEIKNNTYSRILAVCSVDGLDILTGKPAVSSNPGYVIGAYNVGKFDGFRVSDDKVAKFVFGSKGSSYAADKEDGSERNVGVIGIRLFQEKIKPPVCRTEVHHHHYPQTNSPFDNYPIIWCDAAISGATENSDLRLSDTATYSCDNIPTKGITRGAKGINTVYTAAAASATFDSTIKSRSSTFDSTIKSRRLLSVPNEPLRGFDMGTKWGEAKESKVISVEFERGILAVSTEVFYASRQSLIQMGVPIGNEKQVSFPRAFADSKYATPPKNWQG